MARFPGPTDSRAVDVVLGVLPRAAKTARPTGRGRADLTVGQQPLTVRWAGEGSLGEVRRRLATWPANPDIVVARRLSPGARELLANAGIGWADETGAAEIAVGTIVVSRTGRPDARPTRPKRWTPAVVAVAEALLVGTTPTVASTSAVTGLSTGSCIHALHVLTDLGLLDASAQRGRHSARHIADATQLLEAYATAVQALPAPLTMQAGVTWRDPVHGVESLGRQWDEAGIAWAATGAVAAAVLAPHLSTIETAVVYVDAATIVDLEAAVAAAGLRPVEGGRLTLRPFPTVAVRVLARTVDGLRVAPWPRVYVDLIGTGVRGEEAAEHLRDVVHGG